MRKVSNFNISKLVRAGVGNEDILQADKLSLEPLGGYYYLSKGSKKDSKAAASK